MLRSINISESGQLTVTTIVQQSRAITLHNTFPQRCNLAIKFCHNVPTIFPYVLLWADTSDEVPAHYPHDIRASSTLRLVALVVAGRAVVVGPLDQQPRLVIVVAVITTWPITGGDHLDGLLRLPGLARRRLAVLVARHRRRRRLIVTPSPLPPSDLRSSG